MQPNYGWYYDFILASLFHCSADQLAKLLPTLMAYGALSEDAWGGIDAAADLLGRTQRQPAAWSPDLRLDEAEAAAEKPGGGQDLP